MAQCSECKSETELHVNGTPVCVVCDDMSRSKWKAIGDAAKSQAAMATSGAGTEIET
jgi:hypothetical protein